MRPISIAGRFQLCVLAAFTIGGIVSLPTAALSQELQEISRAGEKAILAKPGLQMTGARSPDLTIVEYFDYNCPFCKQVVPTFKQLLAEDKKLAIVYKEWPVLGESSVYAARCALAAGWQDKYLIAHDALISGPRLRRNDQIESILHGAGILRRIQERSPRSLRATIPRRTHWISTGHRVSWSADNSCPAAPMWIFFGS
jgi:protein-disulfide isomerase